MKVWLKMDTRAVKHRHRELKNRHSELDSESKTKRENEP